MSNQRIGRVTLLQQNDTHAHIEPHWELGWRAGRAVPWRTGGYARIKAIADQIRRETDGAMLHVDSGDVIHGTGAAQWTKGASVVPALNAVGVEVMTPGNWEFGFGPEVLRARVQELGFPVLAANVRRAADSAPEFAPCEIREVGGLRVALIGITSPIVSRTMPQPFGAGLRFLEAADVLPEIVASLRERERPDLVVLLSHYGFAQEVEIARRIDGIDVILGGHTHDVLAEPVAVGGTLITQSGAHGSYLTRLDLEVANRRVCGVTHRLIPVDDGPVNATVEAIVADSMRPHRAALDEVVGETRALLHRRTVLESPMDNLITAAYRTVTDADVAVSHGWRYGTPIVPGPITVGDLWQMIPPNPEVFTVKLTGAEIRRMLEQSIERTFAGDPLRQQGGYVMRFDGMHAVARLNNPPGARIAQLEVGSQPVDPAREYTVAAAGEQSVRKREGRVATGIRAVDAIREHLRQVGTVDPSLTHEKLVAI